VNDPADILFIDAHAECDGGHNTGQVPLHELVLNPFPLNRLHAGMIGLRIDAMPAKKCRNPFSCFLQGNIDNARRLRCFEDSLEQAVLFFRCACGRHL